MNTRVLALLGTTLLAIGCAAPIDGDEVGSSADELRAKVTTGTFTLYGNPGHVPTPSCDVSTTLKLSNAPLGIATLTDGLRGYCDLYVPENKREYRLHDAGTSCGSKIYSGRIGFGANLRTIKITDHRTRICRDLVPARVIVEETVPGFPGAITTTLYSYDKAPAAATQWLVISPKQCGGNPWESVTVGNTSLLAGEAGKVDSFFRSKGVNLTDVAFLQATEPRFVCAACSCPRGDLLVVKAKSDADAATLKATYGFADAKNVYAHGTVQCGGNPWEAQGVAGATEPARLGSWLTSQGVETTDVGFAQKAEPFAVCAACQCSRGDLAIAIPKNATEGAELEAQGFQLLK